jgi:hypothetical protein
LPYLRQPSLATALQVSGRFKEREVELSNQDLIAIVQRNNIVSLSPNERAIE